MKSPMEHIVEREFAHLSSAYTSQRARRDYRENIAFREWLPLRPHEIVLDAACGPGILGRALLPSAQSVFGLDLCPRMIQQGRTLAGRRQGPIFTIGTVTQLPYRSHSFDLVACAYAFANFRHPLKVLREFARVTQPGGRIAIIDLIACSHPARRAYLNRLEALRSRSYTRIFSAEEFLRLFARAGLRVISVRFQRRRRNCREWLAQSPAARNSARARQLRRMLTGSIEGDQAGLRPHRSGRDIIFYHPTAWFLLGHASGAA